MPFVDRPERVRSRAALRRFAINRVLRIVPIFVAAVLYLRWLTDKDWTWVTQHLVFAGGWNHLWSVAEEARFYALFPVVMAVLAPLPRLLRLLVFVPLILAAWIGKSVFEYPLLLARF